jgi:hypothetical protein
MLFVLAAMVCTVLSGSTAAVDAASGHATARAPIPVRELGKRWT